MHFAIRYLTEYHYGAPVTDNLNALRVRPATTSSQRCDEFHTRIDPEARVSRHLDYFGTEVLEFGVPTDHDRLTIDVRARVVTSAPSTHPRARGRACGAAPTRTRRVSSRCHGRTSPRSTGLRELNEQLDADSPLEALEQLCQLVPDRFEYRPGVTYVGSTSTTCCRPARGCARTSCTSRWCCCAGAGIAARYVSGYLWAAPAGRRAATRWRWIPTPGWRCCCREMRAQRLAASRCGSGPTPLTAVSRARPT